MEIRIAIAEDHQAVIDGIRMLLEYEEDISVVGTSNNGEDLLKIVFQKQPDIVITDIRMPKLDGIEMTRKIKNKFPYIKVLAFSMFDQPDMIQKMLDVGVSGYILKNSSLKILLDAIYSIYKGNQFFGPNIIFDPENNANKKKGILTKRQMEILQLIAQGKSSKEIAELLFIGVYTVDTHRKNMVKILGLKGKNALMQYALDKKYR